ncbi:MAG TPA: transcriptional repressor [Frankiaceae bacterium]|jgi:Fur family ferric uptake transcriptional regulator|nr:transcriptional repressor [Frankiaceae bacterium]
MSRDAGAGLHTHADVDRHAHVTDLDADAPDWQTKLREGGYRLTAQRQLVLEAVSRLGHATPEDICVEVRSTAHAVNISTIYRNLELLEELGLVAHAHLNHGAPTYHATTEEPHVHLVCSRCDAVEPVSTELVADVVARLGEERGFRVDVRHVTFSGLCKDCS